MMQVKGVITTKHRHPACVADAICPDNLSSMKTVATDTGVSTSITGNKLSSVIASVDDYLMNLAIAEETCSFVSP